MINAFIATRKTDFQIGTALIYLFGMSTNGTGEISGRQIHSNPQYFLYFFNQIRRKSIPYSLSKQKDFYSVYFEQITFSRRSPIVCFPKDSHSKLKGREVKRHSHNLPSL